MSKSLRQRRLARERRREEAAAVALATPCPGRKGQPAPPPAARPSGTTMTIAQSDALRRGRPKKNRKHHRRAPQAPTSTATPDRSRRENSTEVRSRELGYKSYKHYLASTHWRGLRARFAEAWPGACCVACESPEYHLHHATYHRFGSENLTDMLPLCGKCHEELHRSHRENGVDLADYPEALKLGWRISPQQVADMLEDYRRHIH